MKMLCKILAIVSLCAGALMSFKAMGCNDEYNVYWTYVIALCGYALILGIAYSVLNALEEISARIGTNPNPKKGIALDYSFPILCREVGIADAKFLPINGTATFGIDGNIIISDAEYVDEKNETYTYDCIMIHIEGDIYDLSHWQCKNIKIWDKKTGVKHYDYQKQDKK